MLLNVTNMSLNTKAMYVQQQRKQKQKQQQRQRRQIQQTANPFNAKV